MGKDEPVAMDTLVKITTALQCGLDDIVEIQNDENKMHQNLFLRGINNECN